VHPRQCCPPFSHRDDPLPSFRQRCLRFFSFVIFIHLIPRCVLPLTFSPAPLCRGGTLRQCVVSSDNPVSRIRCASPREQPERLLPQGAARGYFSSFDHRGVRVVPHHASVSRSVPFLMNPSDTPTVRHRDLLGSSFLHCKFVLSRTPTRDWTEVWSSARIQCSPSSSLHQCLFELISHCTYRNGP